MHAALELVQQLLQEPAGAETGYSPTEGSSGKHAGEPLRSSPTDSSPSYRDQSVTEGSKKENTYLCL